MSRLFAVMLVWFAIVFAAAACGALPRPGSAESGPPHARPTPAGSAIAVNLVFSGGR
jgi:hypothetical protein